MDIQFALLADHAEIVSGKLYLMGGGWTTSYAPAAPATIRLAIVVGVRVGWEETNQPVPVRMTVENDDGQEFVRIDGQVNVGRPVGLAPGSSQLAQMAANVPVALPAFGGYRVHIVAGGEASPVEENLPFRLEQRGEPPPPRHP
ncbi:MAG: hypothetical protein HY875_17080 [Chloroflexi bacterium]|nr:hypothetical protein [Chloroflexota bacterium]